MNEEIFDQSGEENKPEETTLEIAETEKTPQEQLDEVTGQTPESETPAEPEQTSEPISEEKPEESQSDQA